MLGYPGPHPGYPPSPSLGRRIAHSRSKLHLESEFMSLLVRTPHLLATARHPPSPQRQPTVCARQSRNNGACAYKHESCRLEKVAGPQMVV